MYVVAMAKRSPISADELLFILFGVLLLNLHVLLLLVI